MFLDKEEDIIGYLTCELKKATPLLYNGNSFNKKVLRWIKNIEVFKNNSGHDALPPYFYSGQQPRLNWLAGYRRGLRGNP